jgi:ABC-2 type transport system permease protein
MISLLFGVLIFKVDLSQMNFLASLLILIMTVISFSSIGIISAAFIMVLKKGNPINWLINTFAGLFGGVYFPIEMLPKGLKTISYFIPITYSLRGLRHAILEGYSFKMLMPDMLMLLLFCVVLFPISIWVFKKSVNKAKVTGSLTHY